MKSYFKTIITILALLIFFYSAHSQPKKYTSDEGFWVLSSNIHQKKIATVQYYLNNSNLIYEETLSGICFNIKRKKNLMILKEGLEKSIVAWDGNQKLIRQGDFLTGMIHKRK